MTNSSPPTYSDAAADPAGVARGGLKGDVGGLGSVGGVGSVVGNKRGGGSFFRIDDRLLFLFLLFASSLAAVKGVHEGYVKVFCHPDRTNATTVFDFQFKDLTGNVSPISNYQGKILLIVNTATYCGHTSHLWGLNTLQSKYGSRGFQVLGFPSNQFNQEPGSNKEILVGLKYVRPGRGYVPNFPLSSKLDPNGEEAHPMYRYLRSQCPPTRSYYRNFPKKISYSPIEVDDVRWNYEKFLLDYDGRPIYRYQPNTEPETIDQDIKYLLEKGGM